MTSGDGRAAGMRMSTGSTSSSAPTSSAGSPRIPQPERAVAERGDQPWLGHRVVGDPQRRGHARGHRRPSPAGRRHGGARRRRPGRSAACRRTGSVARPSSCSQPLQEPASTWRTSMRARIPARGRDRLGGGRGRAVAAGRASAVHARVAELEALVDQREVGQEVADGGMGERGPVGIGPRAQAQPPRPARSSSATTASVAPRGLSTRPIAERARRRARAVAVPGADGVGEQVVEHVARRLELGRPAAPAAPRRRRSAGAARRARTRRRRAAGCRRGRRCARRPRARPGPTRRGAARRPASSTPTPSSRARTEPANSSSRHAAAASTRSSRSAPRAASAALRGRPRARRRRRPTVPNRKRWPASRSLIRCARSLSAANAIVPGANPTPAHSAPMSCRWL